MEEEKIISKIVDEIASNIIGKEYVFSSNDLNNNNIIQRHSDKKILVSSPVKKDKEKNDLVKRFVGKKERKSKVIINNDNIGLYLRQERDGNSKWNVHIIDLSINNNPRIETEKFGNDYKKAEKYYAKLFFKYQFNEIKKKEKIKKDNNISKPVKKDKRKRSKGQFPMAMTGMIGGAGLSFAFFLPWCLWIPIQMAMPAMTLFIILGAGGGGMLGWACE